MFTRKKRRLRDVNLPPLEFNLPFLGAFATRAYQLRQVTSYSN